MSTTADLDPTMTLVLDEPTACGHVRGSSTMIWHCVADLHFDARHYYQRRV